MSEHGWRILLVEDDPDDVALMRETVHDMDASSRLDCTGTLDEALDTLGGERYDACLVDYWLGERDGLEFMTEARKRGYDGAMILLTGVGDRFVDLEAMRSGATDYVEKDRIDPALLERLIRYAIERERSRSDLARSNADLRAFADIVSEDLRSPLRMVTVVLENVRQQRKDHLDPDTQASLSRALDAAERMRQVVDELATSARQTTTG